jgi:hypothetical protein
VIEIVVGLRLAAWSERLADQLVEGHLRPLASSSPARRRLDLHLASSPTRSASAVTAGSKPWSRGDRLDVEREVAERLDRLPLLLEARSEDRRASSAGPPRSHGRPRRASARSRRALHGAVVEEQREAAPLVLLAAIRCSNWRMRSRSSLRRSPCRRSRAVRLSQ